MEHSELHLFNPNADQALSLPRNLSWMTCTSLEYLFGAFAQRFAQLTGSSTEHSTLNRPRMTLSMVPSYYPILISLVR